MSRLAWADPRVDGAGMWEHTAPHPRTRLTLFGAFVACAVLTLLFCAAVAFGQKAMCAMDRAATGRGQHQYCADFPAQR